MNHPKTQRMARLLKRRGARGLSLIETLVSVSILAAIVITTAYLGNESLNDTVASATAQHIKTVGDAANLYIQANYARLSTTSTTTPAMITVNELTNTGYLPSGFSAINPLSQSTCVLVLASGTNNAKLNALVVTEGGKAVDDATLGQIASTIGTAGGGVYVTTTPNPIPNTPAITITKFRGSMNGWLINAGSYANAYTTFTSGTGTSRYTCGGTLVNHLSTVTQVSFASGHPVMALWLADIIPSSATLFRDQAPGNPALNTMQTPILMGAGTLKVPGQSCSPNGAIATDAAGGLMSCRNAKWTSASDYGIWKPPLLGAAYLPACTNDNLDEMHVLRHPAILGAPPGSLVRLVACARIVENGVERFEWTPIGLHDDGTMRIPNRASVHQLQVTNTVTAGSLCDPATPTNASNVSTQAAELDTGFLLTCLPVSTAIPNGVVNGIPQNILAYKYYWMGQFGQNQRWHIRTTAPALNTLIQNTSGRPIQFMLKGQFGSSGGASPDLTCTVHDPIYNGTSFTEKFRANGYFNLGPLVVEPFGYYQCNASTNTTLTWFHYESF